MRLKSIGAKYFMGFGPWNEIHFDDEKEIVSIIGQWADEPKRSNRAGKSTLVEAILYGLYGKSRSKKEIDLINKSYPDEDMLVRLVFETEMEEVIVIERGRTASNSIILELSGYEGADKKVVQEQIDKIIGLNYQDFIMTSFFMQGDIHTFMQSGSTGQKQIISRWLEKEYWKEFEKRAKEYQNEIQGEIDALKHIANDKPDVSIDHEIKIGINNKENELKALEEVLEGLNTKLESIKDQINKASKVEAVQNEIHKIKRRISNYQQDIDDLNEEIEDHVEEIKEAKEREEQLLLLPKLKSDIEGVNLKIADLYEDIDKNNKIVASLRASKENLLKQYNQMNEFDAICPVMERACTAIPLIEGAKEEVLEEGKKTSEELKKEKAEGKQLKERMNKLKEDNEKVQNTYREILSYKKLPTVQSITNEINDIKESIKSKKKVMEEAVSDKNEKELELKSLEKIDMDLLTKDKSLVKNEIRVKNSERDDIINYIATSKAKIAQNKEQRKKAIQASKKISELTEELNQYKLVTYMFSKNGIPSNQIEVAFQELEDEANIILEKVNSDITIEFSPDKVMKTWEENCLVCNTPFPKGYRKIECPECGNERQKKRKDDLSITIKTREKEMDFNLESGGGKVLISLAIRIAFVRMLQRRLGVNLKLIVFDEIFGMLDETNRNLVFKLLTTTLKDDFGFKQILCISHEEEIRDVIPDVIKITKYDDHAEFSWE